MRMEEPSLQCVDFVFCELQRIVAQLESQELQRFSNLKDRVVEVVNDLLNTCRTPAKEMISNLVRVELSYINTSHPDFVGGEEAIHQVFEKLRLDSQDKNQNPSTQNGQNPSGQNQNQNQNQQTNPQAQQTRPQPQPQSQPQSQSRVPPQVAAAAAAGRSVPPDRMQRMEQVSNNFKNSNLSEKEKFETELIQTLMVSYFNVVRKTVKDMVPKTIMCFLVNASIDKMQNELVRTLYKDDLFDQLLAESPEIAGLRKECRNRLQVYQRASEILNEVRDFDLK